MAYDPFLGTNPVISAMEARRGRIEQLRQNTSRLAQSYNFVETQGVGHIRLPEVVEFHCTFVEQPVVSTGYSVEAELVADDFPTVSAGVYSWLKDRRGFYVGAYVFAVVQANTDYPIQIDFCFTGIAMKDLPDFLLDI